MLYHTFYILYIGRLRSVVLLCRNVQINAAGEYNKDVPNPTLTYPSSYL